MISLVKLKPYLLLHSDSFLPGMLSDFQTFDPLVNVHAFAEHAGFLAATFPILNSGLISRVMSLLCVWFCPLLCGKFKPKFTCCLCWSAWSCARGSGLKIAEKSGHTGVGQSSHKLFCLCVFFTCITRVPRIWRLFAVLSSWVLLPDHFHLPTFSIATNTISSMGISTNWIQTTCWASNFQLQHLCFSSFIFGLSSFLYLHQFRRGLFYSWKIKKKNNFISKYSLFQKSSKKLKNQL